MHDVAPLVPLAVADVRHLRHLLRVRARLRARAGMGVRARAGMRVRARVRARRMSGSRCGTCASSKRARVRAGLRERGDK